MADNRDRNVYQKEEKSICGIKISSTSCLNISFLSVDSGCWVYLQVTNWANEGRKTSSTACVPISAGIGTEMEAPSYTRLPL